MKVLYVIEEVFSIMGIIVNNIDFSSQEWYILQTMGSSIEQDLLQQLSGAAEKIQALFKQTGI